MRKYLDIPVVAYDKLAGFLERTVAASWQFAGTRPLSAPEREMLDRFCYHPSIMYTTDADGRIYPRILNSGSPYATNLIAATIEGKEHYLLVVEPKAGAAGLTANFVTGLTEKFDTPTDTAQKEMLEECGILSTPRLLGSAYVWASRHDNLIKTADGKTDNKGLFSAFYTKVDEETDHYHPQQNNNEVVVPLWLSRSDLTTLAKTGKPVRLEIDALAAFGLATLLGKV